MAKYGDIPEQFADIGSDKELRGEQPDIESIFEKPSEKDLPEEDLGEAIFDEEKGQWAGYKQKPKAVSVEKTKVTKAPFKSPMPNVIVDRDTSLEAVRKELDRKKKEGSKDEKPKEKVKLSADTFEPEEVELEPGKNDESWKSLLKSLGTEDPGAEEGDSFSKLSGFDQFERSGTPMMVPGFGGAAGKIGKAAGEAIGSKVPPVPSASRMLADKMRLGGKEVDSLTDSIGEPMKKTGEVMKRRLDLATKKYPSALKPAKGGAKLSPSHEAQIRERARSLFEQLKSGKITQSEFAKQLRLLENIVK
jgi:hypothetical protein